MNRIFLSFLFSCFLFTTVFSQTDEILITIDKTEVSKAEFERIYKKNNNNLYNASDKKSPEDYLDLFIDFKLKVIEAENLQMDTSKIFINELAGYRKDLAAPYLTDVKYDEKMVRDLYYRTTKEVDASHILITFSKNATYEQEQVALKKAVEIRQEIIDGKDFETAAVEYSQDPSAKRNKGRLGYFTAFQMVVPFENAAFTTPIGETSEPIRTSFGYHLLQVHDMRDNQGEVLIAHIMKMFPQDATPEIKIKQKAEIDSIYVELQNGADFAEMAKAKSDDKRYAPKGGEMPWFSAGKVIPELSVPAFELNKGDFTPPIESAYGYHLIKKLDSRPVPTFEESEKDLEDRIKRDPQRSITSKKAFIEELKVEYSFQENIEAKEELMGKNVADSTLDLNIELFTMAEKSYGLNEFKTFITNKNIENGTYFSNYDNWVDEEITQYEDSKLEEKYPDFRFLIQEYHDGILLFNISEEKIWNFAAKDTTGLEAYYEKNKKDYLWEERFKGYVVTCKDEKTREEAEKYFAEEMSSEEIVDLLNNSEENLITIKDGAWEQGSNPVVDYFVWSAAEPDNFESALTFIRGDKIEPEPKTLDEARGLYISDYQKYLEVKWLKELRKKYKISVNKKLLKTIEGV